MNESDKSDKNVGSIEELIEELTRVRPDELSKDGLKLFEYINEIIDRNKELEERLKIKKNTPEWEYQYWDARKEVDNEWKSKIKEKIEELNRKIKSEDNEKVIIWLHKQRKILQELLEKR